MSQPAKEVTIEDVVEYEGLKKGQKYKLTGTLMDKKTGEPILVDEKPVISESNSSTIRKTCVSRIVI